MCASATRRMMPRSPRRAAGSGNSARRSTEMITPDYIVAMAAYNAEMNRRLYDAAARLGDAERRRDRGAFWKSIHGTFSHLVWADQIWMSRFDGWEKPAVPLRESDRFIDDFDALRRARERIDAGVGTWAARVGEAWLAEDQAWLSSSAGRDISRPRQLLVMRFF